MADTLVQKYVHIGVVVAAYWSVTTNNLLI
jgi:hypothetical protein